MTEVEREKRRKQRADIAELQRKQDLRALMSLPEFKRYLYDVIDRQAGVFSGSANFSHPHPEQVVFFNEGRRSLGIELMSAAQSVAPESYAAMVLERTQVANALASTLAAEAVPATREGQST